MRAPRPDLARIDRPLGHIGSCDLLLFRALYIGRHPASLLRNCDREVRPVRRADEAGGYAAEFVRPGPCPGPDRARAFAGDVAEGTSERSQAFPARVEGNLSDGTIGVAEQRRRPLDAPREQVAMRRYAEGLLERS